MGTGIGGYGLVRGAPHRRRLEGAKKVRADLGKKARQQHQPVQRSRGGPTPGELEGGKGVGRGRGGYSKIGNLVLVSRTQSLEQRNRACLRRVPLAAVSEGKGGGRKAREENPQSWGLGGGQSQNTLSQQVKPQPCSRSRAAAGTRHLSSEVSLPAQPPPLLPLETVTLDWTRSCGFRKYSSQHWIGGLSLPGTPAHALIEDPCRTRMKR